MKFTKMHGISNDYVYVNCFEETVENPSKIAIAVSDRHKGIGSDGLVLIKPSEIADFTMEMYNADGSQSQMCGNAIRCVGKYVYENGLTDKTDIAIETLAGIKYLQLTVVDGVVTIVRVNMGAPILIPNRIPVNLQGERAVDCSVVIDDKSYNITCVSMGNPHCITYVDDVMEIDINKIGPLFENDPLFPERVNAEFVKVINRDTLQMRVWERGSGETMACGTGACAVAVASILNGLCNDTVTVKLLGGDLQITWDRQENIVYMTGSATTVFTGEWQ